MRDITGWEPGRIVIDSTDVKLFKALRKRSIERHNKPFKVMIGNHRLDVMLESIESETGPSLHGMLGDIADPSPRFRFVLRIVRDVKAKAKSKAKRS